MDARRRIGVGIVGAAMVGLLMLPQPNNDASQTVADVNEVVNTEPAAAPVVDQAVADQPLQTDGMDPRRIQRLEAEVVQLEGRVQDLEARIAVLSDFRDRALAYQARIEEWMANYKSWHARTYGGEMEPTPTMEQNLGLSLAPGEVLVDVQSYGLPRTVVHSSGCVNGVCSPRRGIFRRRR